MEITGGVAVRDVDNDGRMDLFFPRMDAPDVLLRNTTEGFVDVSVEFGLPDTATFSNSAAFADIDNDGDPDLYVAPFAEPRATLYVMEDGQFVDRALELGVDLDNGSLHSQMSACFGDANLDGYLDLHTTEWRHNFLDEPNHARLFLGGPAFSDVTDTWRVAMVNIARDGLWSFTSNFIDVDNDRYPDLLVAADFFSSRVFWNANGSTFFDGTSFAGVGTDENGMGSAVGDIDGDGDLDWFVSSIHATTSLDRCDWGRTGNRMYSNVGTRLFVDTTDSAGVREGGWGWGAAFFDYDLDGDLDLALTNGTRSVCGTAAEFIEDPIRIWENDGRGRFTEVSEELGVVDDGVGRGIVAFDYDNDGDLDLLVTHSLDAPRIWRNDVANGKAWLIVRPIGQVTNRDGVGAVVSVWPTADTAPLVRHAGNGCGFLAHSPGTPHFGLGDLDQVERVEVYWPASDTTQTFANVATRQVLEVVEER